jgi:hypothetical protein
MTNGQADLSIIVENSRVFVLTPYPRPTAHRWARFSGPNPTYLGVGLWALGFMGSAEVYMIHTVFAR